MDNQAIKRQSQFTIYHGFALSLALHAVVVLPIAARQLIPVQQSSEPLVLDFEDVEINERQVDEKVLEQTKGQDVQEEKPAEKPKEAPSPEQQQQPQQAVAPVQESPQEIVTEDMDASPPPPPPQPQQEEKKAVEEKPVEKTTAPQWRKRRRTPARKTRRGPTHSKKPRRSSLLRGPDPGLQRLTLEKKSGLISFIRMRGGNLAFKGFQKSLLRS